MNYDEYREFTNTVDAYLETGNRQTLTSIQDTIKTKEGCRERLMEDLINYHERYIQVFSTDDQIVIVSDLEAQIKQREYLAYSVSWMLPYVSDKSLNQILTNADDVALVKIMNAIAGNIRAIGNRLCDSSTYFWLHTTNIFSRMGERMMWRKLYRKCKRNLN